MTNQRKGPSKQEPPPSQPPEHSGVEQTASPPRRVDREALHSSHQQPAQPDPRHQALIPSPEAKAPQQPANPGGVPPEHRLLTTAEAAAYFRVTERTVEAWRAKRLLPFRKVGRTIRYKLADLLQALDDRFLVRRRQQ